MYQNEQKSISSWIFSNRYQIIGVSVSLHNIWRQTVDSGNKYRGSRYKHNGVLQNDGFKLCNEQCQPSINLLTKW